MQKLLVLLTLIVLSASTLAQSVSLTGSVKDPNDNKPVQKAVVALLTPKDSILYKFTRSDADGKYFFKNVRPGKYILMTTHPYFADVLEEVEITADIEFAPLALLSKAKLLQEVIVKTGSPIKIKGDTTVYTADSFKVSANANVEELLKKLPGIQVDKDGKITAMGQTVEKVLVDGEEFFGDDPGMAVKNLRADAVKEVQVFDKKSDQAVFTGIDDGKSQKTINLKLKENKKTGYFGKVDAAGGLIQNIDPRYNDNVMFSTFKGSRKFSAYLLNGNTGQDRLSWQDEQKYGSNDNFSMSMDDNGDVSFMWNGSSDQEPYVDPQNGYMTNVNAGAQYSNKWNDNANLNFSPKYNNQNYNNHKTTFTETQVGDSVLDETADDVTHVSRYNFKNKMTFDYKIDSMNSMKLTANANFYHTQSSDLTNEVSTGNSGILKNSSNRNLQTESDKSAISGELLFKHKFKKARRTFSVTADWYSLNNNGKDFLKSINQAYFNGISSGSQTIDQMKDYDNSTTNLSAKFIYTEPLSKKYSLELDYQLASNSGKNNQFSYNYTPSSGKYDAVIDSLSNQFKQSIIQSTPSAKINYADKKIKMNIGSGFGFANFDLKDLTYNKDYQRNYVNFFPTGNITYTIKPNNEIRINYNGYTTQPTINQLQPLRNNNDYFNQYIGNPNLKPSFTSAFYISHSNYNFVKDIFFYQNFNIRAVSNAITNNRIINVDSAKTITQPINTYGNISININTGMGFKIKKIDTRLNFSPYLNYTKNADVINSNNSFSKTIAPGFYSWISKSKEKKYDISVNDQFSYNSNTTSQNNNRIHYITNTVYFNATVYYKKVWSVITEYQYDFQQRSTPSESNININLLNARLQRTFKKDEFTAYFTLRDILNQNVGIQRNISSNIYTETINDRLKRYFLIGFTWNFKNK